MPVKYNGELLLPETGHLITSKQKGRSSFPFGNQVDICNVPQPPQLDTIHERKQKAPLCLRRHADLTKGIDHLLFSLGKIVMYGVIGLQRFVAQQSIKADYFGLKRCV